VMVSSVTKLSILWSDCTVTKMLCSGSAEWQRCCVQEVDTVICSFGRRTGNLWP
jgi:hypothetical protein